MSYVESPQSYCRFGFARCDITPPIGMYHRMWGAAAHDVSTGVHRPLLATALAFEPIDALPTRGSDGGRKILVALDHCVLFGNAMDVFRRNVERAAALPPDQLQITFTHTHAAGFLDIARVDMPGGELLPLYLTKLEQQIAALACDAVAQFRPCWIVYGTGRCNLAAHRDYWDEQAGQYVCGFNPEGPADDTVLVAKISDDAGRLIASIVNYACHPTTLAWQNTLISPDFPGPMRDTVEAGTGAPCQFLQGASGDLGPREGFVGDVTVAERNGRQLAFASLAALEALSPPATRFEYAGSIMSGTKLGCWRHEPLSNGQIQNKARWRSRQWRVRLPLRQDLCTREHAESEMLRWQRREQAFQTSGDSAGVLSARAHVERWRRELARLQLIPEGGSYPLEVAAWQIGDAFWVAVAGEHYQFLQTALRAKYPDMAVIVITLNNSSLPSYVPTAETYGRGIYQETIALVASGSLELFVDEIGEQLDEWRCDRRPL